MEQASQGMGKKNMLDVTLDMDMVSGEYGDGGGELDFMVLEIFSNLNNSMIPNTMLLTAY